MPKRDDEQFFAGLADEALKERWLAGEDLTTPAAPVVKQAAAPEVPPAPKPIVPKNLFSSVEAHPVVLDFALLKVFHTEWFAWLPETLFAEIEAEFKTSVAEANKTKVLATQTLHVTDAFWTQWEIFEKTVAALNGVVPRLEFIQPPEVFQLLTAVDAVGWIRKEEFSEEVGRYAAACFLHDNILYAPPPCAFAQPFISQPRYRCQDCGKEGSALPPFDGYCDSCTHRFTQEHGLSFRPDPERVAKGYGQRLSYFLEHDPAPIKKRFEALEATPLEDADLKETDVDVQVGKLIVAVDYMKSKRQQMVEQLRNLQPWLEGA